MPCSSGAMLSHPWSPGACPLPACLACVGNAAGEGEDNFLHVKPPPRCLVIITLLPTTARSLEAQRHCAVCTGSTTAVYAGARLASLTRCIFSISWSFEHQVAEMMRERERGLCCSNWNVGTAAASESRNVIASLGLLLPEA